MKYIRVTGRKDTYGEVKDFICNTCRFDTKDLAQWTIEGPRHIERDSVIGQGHYEVKTNKYSKGFAKLGKYG
jgi:NADH-quinone oxidoreductase subunit G